MRREPHITGRRTGFTLVELLVVILIIAILAGLSYAVLGRTGSSARIAATRSTLEQLDSLLSERIEAFRRHDFRNAAAVLVARYNAVEAAAPGTNPQASVTSQAAERMVRKNAFRGFFPSRFEDLFGLDGVDGDGANIFIRDGSYAASDFSDFGLGDDAALAGVVATLVNNGTFDPTAHDDATESAELLYLCLTRGTAFGVPHGSLDNIDADHMVDTDGDGLIEFVDDWGEPLRFYNWPTGLMWDPGALFTPVAAQALVADAPANTPAISDWTAPDYANPLCQDPDDPFGELGVYFAPDFSLDDPPVDQAGFDTTAYHHADTWHRPLIVSVGIDGDLGLAEPVGVGAARLASPDGDASGTIDAAEIEELSDNVTNRQAAGGN